MTHMTHSIRRRLDPPRHNGGNLTHDEAVLAVRRGSAVTVLATRGDGDPIPGVHATVHTVRPQWPDQPPPPPVVQFAAGRTHTRTGLDHTPGEADAYADVLAKAALLARDAAARPQLTPSGGQAPDAEDTG